jgi:hypothetical protein
LPKERNVRAKLLPLGICLDTMARPTEGKRNRDFNAFFVVRAYSSSGADLLVNEIGPYLGEVLLGGGTYFLEVIADGAWTIAPS